MVDWVVVTHVATAGILVRLDESRTLEQSVNLRERDNSASSVAWSMPVPSTIGR